MKKKTRILTLGLFAILSLSMATISNAEVSPPTHPIHRPEVLMGFVSSDLGLTFQVYSGGCTDEMSFDLTIQEIYPPVVTIYRKSEDHCRMYLPHGTTIFYSFTELGISDGTFSLGNQISPGSINTVPN